MPLSDPLPAHFHTTRWSVVLAARGGTTKDAADSLEALCRQYWPPLYSFVRQRGHAVHDAQDLTQAFFARLLEKNWLTAADQAQGRFRSFMLMALKRFLANEWNRASAQKRGGGADLISFDLEDDETMPIPDPNVISGEALFDRRWALTLLEAVMWRLRSDYGENEAYELLKPHLTAERGSVDYTQLAQELKMEPASARSALHRLRKRFRELFREEVAGTVANEADVDDELRAIVTALGAE